MAFKSFPYSNALTTYVDLAVKIGQGHPMVIIYIHIVDLESLMLHAKFQDPRPVGSGEEDF